MRSEVRFLPKDFVETWEGLFFAVVVAYPEDDEVLATLRYVPNKKGPHKLATAAAVAYLQERHPQYLRHSIHVDAVLPAVPWSAVARHFRPEERVRSLLQRGPRDPIERKACWLLREFASAGIDLHHVGLTGSLLIEAHTVESDLDFVAYEEGTFQALRRWVQTAVGQGRLNRPNPAAWKDAYERRGCALDSTEYLWHERRKFNQGWVQGTKFDLTLVVPGASPPPRLARKLGMITLRAKVADASRAFEFPARYRIEHPRIHEVLSFTHTYAGQAFAGETIEACGWLEVWEDERERLIVGSSREAPGEFIKVLPDA
jgi:predicted nucleotidyltransferase